MNVKWFLVNSNLWSCKSDIPFYVKPFPLSTSANEGSKLLCSAVNTPTFNGPFNGTFPGVPGQNEVVTHSTIKLAFNFRQY